MEGGGKELLSQVREVVLWVDLVAVLPVLASAPFPARGLPCPCWFRGLFEGGTYGFIAYNENPDNTLGIGI